MTIPPGSALADLLAQELGLLHSFVTLLRHEQALLVDGKADSLAGMVEEKTGLGEQLAARAAARSWPTACRKCSASAPRATSPRTCMSA